MRCWWWKGHWGHYLFAAGPTFSYHLRLLQLCNGSLGIDDYLQETFDVYLQSCLQVSFERWSCWEERCCSSFATGCCAGVGISRSPGTLDDVQSCCKTWLLAVCYRCLWIQGAVCRAASDEVQEVLSRSCHSKGAYTRLLSPIQALLLKVNEFEEAGEQKFCPTSRETRQASCFYVWILGGFFRSQPRRPWGWFVVHL